MGFIGGVGHPLCVWGDRGMGSFCRDCGWRRDTGLEQDCSLYDVSGQRDVGPSAASNPPCHSHCSDNDESHPSVIHLRAGWPNSGISLHFQLFLPFCSLWRNHSAGDMGFPLVLWLCGSRIQAFLTVAACPSSAMGSDPAGGQGVPKLLLCPHLWKVYALASMLLCLR